MRPHTHKSLCEHALRSADTHVSLMYPQLVYCIYAFSQLYSIFMVDKFCILYFLFPFVNSSCSEALIYSNLKGLPAISFSSFL